MLLEKFGNLSQHITQCHQGYASDQEDCLTLNIWRPVGIQEYETLPVMVYFYGGSNQYGSSHNKRFDGSILGGEYRQIVVAMNYRMGIFGYMNYFEGPGQHSGGNYGLLDQQTAIEFIRGNAQVTVY